MPLHLSKVLQDHTKKDHWPEALKEEIPAGRLAKPEEVAQLLLQLARSDSYLTGQIIGFDGGWI